MSHARPNNPAPGGPHTKASQVGGLAWGALTLATRLAVTMASTTAWCGASCSKVAPSGVVRRRCQVIACPLVMERPRASADSSTPWWWIFRV